MKLMEHAFTESRDQGPGRCHWCSLPVGLHLRGNNILRMSANQLYANGKVSPLRPKGVRPQGCSYAACPHEPAGESEWGPMCQAHLELDRVDAATGKASRTHHTPVTVGSSEQESMAIMTGESVSLSEEQRAPIPALQVEMVRVGDLNIDTSYQRELNPRRVKRYSADFQPIQVGILEVARRENGTLWVVDGQHRAALVKQLYGEDARLPAQVYEGWSVRQEAERFGYVNKERVQVTPLAAYKADRAKGAQDVHDIDGVLGSYNVRVSEQAGDGTVQCVTELRAAYARYGRSGMANGIATLVSVWGTQRDAFRTSLVASACWVVNTYGTAVDIAVLVESLKAQYYSALTLYKRALSRREELGGDVTLNVSSLMVETYNAAVPAKKRLPMPSDVRPTATKRVNDISRLEQLQREARDAARPAVEL